MKKILWIIPLLITCSSPKEKSEYEILLEYEGLYEYIDRTTLSIQVSSIDTTLYAIVDKAKYPLKRIDLDSFVNIQKIPVVFYRDKNNEVSGYKAGGQNFNLIDKKFEKMEMLPRKELFQNPNAYQYKQPEESGDGLNTGHLKNEFKNPEFIIDMVRATIQGKFPDVHSVLIYRNGKLVLEEYFYGYKKDTPHQLRSATKPFIGLLLGIAIDKGYIKSEKEKIIPFFNSEYTEIANLDERKKAISIENFLMYRHGMDCENNNPQSEGNEQSMMQSNDWVRYTLNLPMVSQPGISSSYCTGISTVIGSLIEVVTKESIEDFANSNLFQPMNITNYDWTFEPNQSSMETFNQMSIRPRDLIKLAKMYKAGGSWQNEKIVSTEWVDKTFNMTKGDYGYFWKHKYFIIDGKKYDSYMASGNGGQKINIWPDLEMITVFTGGNYNSYELYQKSTPPNQMIPDYILKAVE